MKGLHDLKPAHRSVSPLLIEESRTPSAEPSLPISAEKLIYTRSPFQHTRSVRFEKVSELIKSNAGKLLTTQDFIFLLLIKNTIDDRDSKTSLLIEEYLTQHLHPEEKDWGNLTDLSNLEKFEFLVMSKTGKTEKDSDYYYKAAKFYQQQFPKQHQAIFFSKAQIKNRLVTVIDLHRLISNKETQILGFKVVFKFKTDERSLRRAQQYDEMEDIFFAARYIFYTLWQIPENVPKRSGSEIESVSQEDATTRFESDSEEILQAKIAEPHPLDHSRFLPLGKETLPVDAEKILQKLLRTEPAPLPQTPRHDF